MPSEYAVVITTTVNYMPGTNASLNAFKYYGMEADIFVLTIGDFLSDEYKKQWGDNIHFEVMESSENKKRGWWCKFYDLIYSLKNLFDKYSVVLFWGGDVCLVNNIQEYFLISEHLDKVIVGTNEHGVHDMSKVCIEKWPYVHHWNVPYADVPLFIPSGKKQLAEKMLEYQGMIDCRLSKMDGMNYAIKELNIKPYVVPGELWVQNVPYRVELQKKGNELYIKGSSTRLNSFHRKYWIVSHCRKYLAVNDISTRNKMIFNQFYNFFNKKCFIKWEEGIEVWNGK